jgi:hypothetical protein
MPASIESSSGRPESDIRYQYEPELEDEHESEGKSADVNSVIYVQDPGFVTIPAPDDEGLQALIAH